MIRLDNVSKQVGHQILFIEASAALQKGEKIGLVGPNGAGKTTLFRMISGQEQPDEGQVAVDRGISIGYFSQDVGEMSGHSAVAEVMNGAGPVSTVASELKELEAAMADPARADDMDEIIARYGEVQGRFEELDGYALEGRAREALSGLGFSQEMMDGDVGALSGGWKMRVALARILLMRPDAMLLDEPSNHLDLESLIWLEQFLRAYEGALLMTSHDREFMNRIVNKVVEIDGGQLTTYSGNYEFYEQQRALNEKQQQAQFERQQAMLAKEIKFIERFKARASHAAQVQSRVKKLEKIDRVEPPRRRQTVSFEFLSLTEKKFSLKHRTEDVRWDATASALDLTIPEAASEVVVDHSGGLHESVADGGADKSKTAALQVFAHGDGLLGCSGQVLAPAPGIPDGSALDKLPDVAFKAAKLFLHIECCLSIAYSRFDLAFPHRNGCCGVAGLLYRGLSDHLPNRDRVHGRSGAPWPLTYSSQSSRRSFNSRPLSTHVYRSCRSPSSKKPSFYAPCSPFRSKSRRPTPLTS